MSSAMSNICLDFVLNHVESILKLIIMSTECPPFVQLQGDQVFFVKNFASKLCPWIVRWFFPGIWSERKTKSGHKLDFKKFFGQKVDLDRTKPGHWGQSLDKLWMKTKVGQNQDNIRTKIGQTLDMDKLWTKSGGLTLTWSTENFSSAQRRRARFPKQKQQREME